MTSEKTHNVGARRSGRPGRPTVACLALAGAIACAILAGCGGADETASGGPDLARLAAPPAKALFGMLWVDAKDGREWIFDGTEWVPHDAGVDGWYQKKDRRRPAGAPASLVTSGPDYCGTTYICSQDPMHRSHAAFLNDCEGCHRIDWATGMELLWFDQPVNPATGQPRPAYIQPTAAVPVPPRPSYGFETTSTCSNVACHGVPPGTFSYYFPGGDGEPELRTVGYGGTYATTPSWHSTPTGSCVACHENPPRSGAYHSGLHAGGPAAATNQCQFCHPDASGSGGAGLSITNLALHANGTVNVQARFRSSCFGCH